MKPIWMLPVALGLLLTACATRPPLPKQAIASPFVVERDLVGQRVARGSFRAINGVNRGLTARLDGQWDGTTLTLIEDFTYDDGEKDRKTWRLTRTGPGRFEGTREDVVGTAIGYQDGSAFRLEYDLRLPSQKGQGLKVRFRDVMVLDSDGSVLNNATVGWSGLRIGSVSLKISPPV